MGEGMILQKVLKTLERTLNARSYLCHHRRHKNRSSYQPVAGVLQKEHLSDFGYGRAGRRMAKFRASFPGSDNFQAGYVSLLAGPYREVGKRQQHPADGCCAGGASSRSQRKYSLEGSPSSKVGMRFMPSPYFFFNN